MTSEVVNVPVRIEITAYDSIQKNILVSIMEYCFSVINFSDEFQFEF